MNETVIHIRNLYRAGKLSGQAVYLTNQLKNGYGFKSVSEAIAFAQRWATMISERSGKTVTIKIHENKS